MTKAVEDIQKVLETLTEQASSSGGPICETIEKACQLIRCLIHENTKPCNAFFQLENDHAMCVSDLFSLPSRANNTNNDVKQEANAFLLHEHILKNLADGITVQDKDLNIIYQNDFMQRMFGSHFGEKCYEVYERRSEPCEACGVNKAFQTGEPTLVLRTAYEANGATSFWENACFPIFDSNRNIIAGVEVCRNVSTRVTLEQEVKDRNIQLAKLNEQLKQQTIQLVEALHHQEQAEIELRCEMERRQQIEMQLRQAQKLEAVGQLASGLAHEINTPAQFVSDNLTFLRDSFNDIHSVLEKYRQALSLLPDMPVQEKVLKDLSSAESTADIAFIEQSIPSAFADALDGISRISTIVKAMTDFARPDQSEKSPEDLNKALLATLTIARNEYKDVADIETDLKPLPLVPCHLGDINQVFLKLLVNAAHAVADVTKITGKKGLISVRTTRESDNVCIVIEDTGCGIPVEIRQRVFEPFFTTKDVGKGRGQGLAIAYSIVVDKHQGSLTFESEIGKGTIFSILLPVSA